MAAAALGPLRGAAEVGVWHGGRALFGTARNRVAEAPAQALFEVGSISKVFTGLLLAQAVAPEPARLSARCDGRKRCSQMRSCEEATWFLKNCPGMEMDGDGDGVPCERQWCRP